MVMIFYTYLYLSILEHTYTYAWWARRFLSVLASVT